MFKVPSYYINFAEGATNILGKHKLDENGIPLKKIKYRKGYFYRPSLISQYGLAYHNLYLETKDEKYLDKFLSIARWFIENLEILENGYKGWVINFKHRYFKLTPPWISALSQGRGISVLARAYDVTGEQIYYKSLKEALELMLLEVSEGGVKSEQDGFIYLEEFPTNKPAHVLNGFIFACWGLYDYLFIEKDPIYEELLDECLYSLEENLNKYDAGYWTYYDQNRDLLVNDFYHYYLHTLPIKKLYEQTNKNIFRDYAQRWQNYCYTHKVKLYRNFSRLNKYLKKFFGT